MSPSSERGGHGGPPLQLPQIRAQATNSLIASCKIAVAKSPVAESLVVFGSSYDARVGAALRGRPLLGRSAAPRTNQYRADPELPPTATSCKISKSPNHSIPLDSELVQDAGVVAPMLL